MAETSYSEKLDLWRQRRELICALYAQDKTAEQIGLVLGISRARVASIIKKQGLHARPRGPRIKTA